MMIKLYGRPLAAEDLRKTLVEFRELGFGAVDENEKISLRGHEIAAKALRTGEEMECRRCRIHAKLSDGDGRILIFEQLRDADDRPDGVTVGIAVADAAKTLGGRQKRKNPRDDRLVQHKGRSLERRRDTLNPMHLQRTEDMTG